MSTLNNVVNTVVYAIAYLKANEERVTVLKAVHEESKLFVSVDGKPKSYNLRNLEFADGSIQKGDKFIVNVSKAEYTEQSQTDRNGNPIYNMKSGYTIRKDDRYEKPILKKGMVDLLKQEAKEIKSAKAVKIINKIVKVQIG